MDILAKMDYSRVIEISKSALCIIVPNIVFCVGCGRGSARKHIYALLDKKKTPGAFFQPETNFSFNIKCVHTLPLCPVLSPRGQLPEP